MWAGRTDHGQTWSCSILACICAFVCTCVFSVSPIAFLFSLSIFLSFILSRHPSLPSSYVFFSLTQLALLPTARSNCSQVRRSPNHCGRRVCMAWLTLSTLTAAAAAIQHCSTACMSTLCKVAKLGHGWGASVMLLLLTSWLIASGPHHTAVLMVWLIEFYLYVSRFACGTPNYRDFCYSTRGSWSGPHDKFHILKLIDRGVRHTLGGTYCQKAKEVHLLYSKFWQFV